ncbi:hypothetical protein Q4601_18910 [Shewanella sp. 1_MG-2023]|uniref:Uncharacterized protein n=1 Tax=Shewanella electrodiphila TaxID=934143 RepID=A0ABT0KVB9_9GAMM|nr:MULTISPECIES: hypothetical protein [Shewanella]MCL1047793.1 hypothetical protein [Shewanella electrodiphila]MDO6613672.1 hypothetical protein [Shewanella sp. 7_MG-2023]MDO6773472.1 hypothetical protein [Shewanella sp. 2_MG-2023]MDO6796368.1 hypothetical protein [Shewanella sp. 1_MG-2023]PMG71997.1 hypothetical protein BCU84_20095 [Shewanella sp. 10N.286.51.B7]
MPTKTDKKKRLVEAIETLTSEYDKYSQAAVKQLPALETKNNESLEKLLEVVLLRESLSQRTTNKAPASVKLRASIADVILLNDDFDRKLISANAAAAAEAS